MRLLFTLLCVLVTAPALAQDEEPSQVRARLVTEHQALVPGRTQLVGVHLSIDPAWHIYWLSSGATGAPTELKVTSHSKGLELGPPVWPAPSRYVHDAMVDFVYEDEVTILLPVTVDPRAKPGSELKLAVKVAWLVCKEVCIPGEADLELTLRVAAKPGVQTKDAALFTASRGRSATVVPKDVTATWTSNRVLEIRAPRATRMVWFPLAPENVEPESILDEGERKGDRLRVTYPKRIYEQNKPVKGLLELIRKGKSTFHWIELPAPPKPRPRKVSCAPTAGPATAT